MLPSRDNLRSCKLLWSRSLHRATIALAVATISLPHGARAQSDIATASVRVRGSGSETWVLLTGIVGGTASMQRLESCLVSRGVRVVTIDAYGLSIDSANVNFASLATRVDAELERLHVHHARVVGHSHGGGIALRLAASYPDRVASLDLLDVGALAINRTRVMGRSMSLIPMIAHVPGARALLRKKFVGGIRENSGNADWFDATSERAYTEWMFNDIGRAVQMMQRLSRAVEPEPVSTVIARVLTPVTVILGAVPHASGASDDELAALTPLGARFRLLRMTGVGHFPHEEAPERLLLALGMGAPALIAGKSQW